MITCFGNRRADSASNRHCQPCPQKAAVLFDFRKCRLTHSHAGISRHPSSGNPSRTEGVQQGGSMQDCGRSNGRDRRRYLRRSGSEPFSSFQEFDYVGNMCEHHRRSFNLRGRRFMNAAHSGTIQGIRLRRRAVPDSIVAKTKRPVVQQQDRIYGRVGNCGVVLSALSTGYTALYSFRPVMSPCIISCRCFVSDAARLVDSNGSLARL